MSNDVLDEDTKARYAMCLECLSKPGLPGGSRCAGELETRLKAGMPWRNPYHVEGHPGLEQPYGPDDLCSGCPRAEEHALRRFVSGL